MCLCGLSLPYYRPYIAGLRRIQDSTWVCTWDFLKSKWTKYTLGIGRLKEQFGRERQLWALKATSDGTNIWHIRHYEEYNLAKKKPIRWFFRRLQKRQIFDVLRRPFLLSKVFDDPNHNNFLDIPQLANLLIPLDYTLYVVVNCINLTLQRAKKQLARNG